MFNMKTYLKKLIRGSLSWTGVAAAALLLGGSVQTSQAASADPSAGSSGNSFTWDLLSKGAGQRGIALITFSNDSTFRGYQMLAAIPPNTNSSNGGRGTTADRSGSTGSSGKTSEFLFGFSPINGTWRFGPKGQLVGFFTEALNVISTVTNYLDSTVLETIANKQQPDETTIISVHFNAGEATVTNSSFWLDPTPHTDFYPFTNDNFTVGVGSAESTNVVSFTGNAAGNKHLTLVCNTSFGKVTYTGIPAVTSLDLTGDWIGSKRESGQQFNEFFSLVSFTQDNPFAAEFPDIASFPNVFFTTNGIGAGYGFTGVAIISQHKTIGFDFVKDDGTMRSTIGTLKPTKNGPTTDTIGIEEPFNRVELKATLLQ
jgi:hypothetical protein